MKKALSNPVAWLVEGVVAVLSLILFTQEQSIGLLIPVVVALGAFLTPFFLRDESCPRMSISIGKPLKGMGPTRSSANTPHRREGNTIIFEAGTGIGERELNWRYTLTIANHSSHHAYKPELFVKDSARFPMAGKLSDAIPITAESPVMLELRFRIDVDGSPQDHQNARKPDFPEKFANAFKAVLKYQGETGTTGMMELRFDSGSQTCKRIKKMPEGFERAKIYPNLMALPH